MATDGALGSLSRRAVLAGLGTALIPLRAEANSPPLFLAGCRLSDGQMAAAIFDGAGHLEALEPIDGRGHGGARSPGGDTAVLFARRPGRFAVVFDLRRRRRVGAFQPPADRRFAGHGAFSADGRILYAAENDFENERGVVGLYDASGGYGRLGEFSTHGVGPHELVMLQDGRTLAVANGGIATHPDYPRVKLNLATMAPSLVLLDAEDGALQAKAELAPFKHQLSIRHLTEVGRGTLWFGAQDEGPKGEPVPLVGTFEEGRLSLIEAPGVYGALNRYVGSVAASRDGQTVLTTSPRGGTALEWDVASRTVRRVHPVTDVSGAAPQGERGLIMTAGTGEVAALGEAPVTLRLAWDNHVTAL